MSVKENTSWQNIPITAGGGKKDLICFEELIDYELMQDDLKSAKPVTLSTLSKKVQKKKKRLMEIQAKKHSLEEDVGQFDAAKKKKRVATTSDEHDILVAKKQMKRKKNKQKKKLSETLPVEENLNSEEEIDCDIDMSDWDELMIPEEILKALREMSFTKPTLIQKQVIPKAIGEKSDILAAAETGSGKTLAFGIPLLHHMIEDRARGLLDAAVESDEEFEFEEDNTVLKNTEEEEGEEEDNIVNVSHDSVQEKKILPALILTPTRELAVQVKNHLVKVARHTGFKMVAVIGGMSAPKQERLLKKNPDIVVATPGRLWEFVEQGHPYLLNLHRIRYLVIDEADRMLERGHFEELEKILKIINRKSKVQTKRQTYMFSATLTTVHDAPNRARMRGKTITKAVKLETLMGKIGIRENRHVIDITTRKGTAEKLYEAKIICNSKEKDHYLYYFLKCHPGRTLVFTNSIDCIFHLVSVLDALLLTPLHLHSKMQQRQRLKHLDRFHSRPNSVLIASDVAARGLDIPNVQHVVHYQIPRTCETYIHRSGRSARTGKEGLSVMLISPEELPVYKRLCNSLKLEEQMPQFPVDEDSIRAIKRIVNLAKEIDSLNHKTKKVRINNDWFSKAAAEMEIELDDDVMMRDDHIYETKQLLHEKQKEMKSLLQQPVIPKHFSGKYLTRTGKLSLPGVEQSNAIQKLKKAKKGGSISMPSSQL